MRQLHIALLSALGCALSFSASVAQASVLSPEIQVLNPASAENQFAGTAVAIDGDLALVGVPGAAGGAPGEVVAYQRTGGVWMPLTDHILSPLSAIPAGGQANFGSAIAIDGTRAVIGAPNHATGAGAAFVFDWDGTDWVPDPTALVRPVASAPRFGSSVAISGDRIAVGAPGTLMGAAVGVVVVFETPTSVGVVIPSVSTMAASDDLFGASVALAGTTLVVGAPSMDGTARDGGVAYAFDLADDVWTLRSTFIPDPVEGTAAGTSVAISADGLLVAIGAPRHGAEVSENSGGVFVSRRSSRTEDFGARVVVVSEEPANSTYFGTRVAIDGPRLLVGAPLFGTMPRIFGRGYLFEDRDGAMVATARFSLADDTPISAQARLGDVVALSGDTVMLGAPNDAGPGARVGLVGVFLVPGVRGAGCSLDARCESNVCGESDVCCEMDCGPCGRCDGSGLCMDVMNGESCTSTCGAGMCSSGECVAACDAGTSDDLVRIRVSGCACRAGNTNGRGGLLIGLGVALALWRRRRSKS